MIFVLGGRRSRPPCSTLQGRINAAPTGSILDVSGCVFTAPATIDKALTLVGGTLSIDTGSTNGLTITASNVTIDGMRIRGYQNASFVWAEKGIYAGSGLTLSNLTIRNCDIATFGNAAIWLGYTGSTISNVQIDHNVIADVEYMGVSLIHTTGGVVEDNNLYHIGESGYQNSYGISMSAVDATPARCSNIIVRRNLIEDIYMWHGIDTHGGIDIEIYENTTYRVRRPIFLTQNNNATKATRVLCHDNILGSTVGRTDYPDRIAVTLYNTVDNEITGNDIYSGYTYQGQYPGAGNDRVNDYDGLSTGEIVTGNSLI